jgi:riboflavin transporter FmnP
MRAPLATAIAIGIGLVILAGYFLPFPQLTALQTTLLGWAVVVGAFAGLVAIINLVLTHWRKATSKTNRDSYSFIVLVGFTATLVAGLWFGPGDPLVHQVVQSIQLPVEASLMAALAITLGYASLRLLRQRRDGMSILFVISAVVFLILSSGFLTGLNIPVVRDIAAFIDRLPVAGARGILLGVALGSLTAGLRILMGADRPYSG